MKLDMLDAGIPRFPAWDIQGNRVNTS